MAEKSVLRDLLATEAKILVGFFSVLGVVAIGSLGIKWLAGSLTV